MSRDPRPSSFGSEIIGALNELLEVLESGERLEDHFRTRVVPVESGPPAASGPDVAELRSTLGLSRDEFARFLGVHVRTLRGWEQGARSPSAVARRFLAEIAADPEHWRQRLARTAEATAS